MSDLSVSICDKHNDEPVTAFCLQHEQTLCMKCLLGAHKECVHEDSVEYISDTAIRVEKEIPEAIRTYEHLTSTSKKWSDKYQSSLERLQQTEDRLVCGIKQMRKRMIEQTNKLAAEALEIINSVVQDQRSMVQHDIDVLEEFNRKMTDIQSNIDRCKADNDVVIGEMLYVVSTVKDLHSKFQTTELIDRDVKVHFYVSEELQYMRTNLRSFGELCVEDPKCKNTGLRSRLSKISLAPSLSIDSTCIGDDEIDSSVFVLPKAETVSMNDRDLYYSIHVETPTPCPPPPPLPDMHPVTPIEEKHAFNEHKFQTLPRMRLNHQISDGKTNSFYSEASTPSFPPIPPLPRKRTSWREPENTDVTAEKYLSGEGRLRHDPTYDMPNQIATEIPTNDVLKGFEAATNKFDGQEIDNKIPPEIKVRPPTMTEKLARIFEKKATEETTKLSPRFAKSPHSHLKRVVGQVGSGSESSINSNRDSGIVIAGGKIPPLPKMHRPRFSLNRRTDSIISDDSDLRHSDNECLPNRSKMPLTAQKSSSLTNVMDGEYSRPSISSESSTETSRSCFSASSNASLVSSSSRDLDSSVSDETFTSDTSYQRKNNTEMRFAPSNRKSVNYNLMFSKSAVFNAIPKTPPPLRHSSINGIAVTSSGMLFICDTENNFLQLFDPSGTPVFDYPIKEPFSCCTVRDEVVAVTSRDRKTLCFFDLSNSKIACQLEHFISAEDDIFGVGYTKGFFGICCGDRVIIITESLQPYRIVKPVVMVKKKRSRSYFVDVHYIDMEWSKLGFFIYTSEHKSDRVSCVLVGSRDRPVWNSHVGKPNSVILSKETVLVAAKHKIVVLEAATGHRLREVHHEVPTHPVHMVLRDGWLYMSKKTSSDTESRNIRKLPFTTT